MNIMFICLLITCALIGCSKCSDDTHETANGLEILPESMANGLNILLRRVEDTLNLTCRVFANKHMTSNNVLPKHRLSWHLPHLIQQNSQNRVQDVELYNARVLIIEHLKESDTGEYECVARLDSRPEEIAFREKVRVNVKNKKGLCGDQMFQCSTKECIARRYLCDGKDDCKDGADENELNCGPRPCEGKLSCDDGRCIPTQWCCDQYQQANCTVKFKHTCCSQYIKHHGFVPHDFSDLTEQQRFNEMGFLQTTIYTVIGCAMAFMFIVTILVIAICRVHMKRSLLSRCVNGTANRSAGNVRGRGVAGQPLYDLDVFLNRSTFPPDTPPHSGLLVTYNINNGIQLVGRPVDPPPYCEVVASPPREGPPPPYASRENVSAAEYEPLIATENVSGNTLRITVVNPARSRLRTATIGRANVADVVSNGSAAIASVSANNLNAVSASSRENVVASANSLVENASALIINNINNNSTSNSDDGGCLLLNARPGADGYGDDAKWKVKGAGALRRPCSLVEVGGGAETTAKEGARPRSAEMGGAGKVSARGTAPDASPV